MSSDVDKVIVTNASALRKKHGTKGFSRVNSAISALVHADAERGIVTRLIAIDRKADMQGIGKVVTKSGDRRQVKRAVDEICARFEPDYTMLLGAPDVVPHQRLENPVYSPLNDPDKYVESDLPYACSAKYETDISRFLGPTRVVGRLADVQSVGDTDYLTGLLGAAAGWRSKSVKSYGKCFCVSAQSWKDSTRTSVGKLFGSQKGVKTSPHDGPDWTKKELRDRVHFINCHGDTALSEFFGENEDDEYDQPVAHRASHLVQRLNTGTVAAAECCYGAELYEPIGAGQIGICQTYLGEGAWGFLGSSNIAYGPASGNGYADLICVEFLRAVRAGASLGRAALTAQQKYIAKGGHMDPYDLKTIAQFLLLGDPSIHPVKSAPKAKTRTKTKTKTKSSASGPKRRHLRRENLRRRGAWLDRSIASASRADSKLTAKLRSAILKRSEGLRPESVMSFRLRPGQAAAKSVVAKRLTAASTSFHILIEKATRAKSHLRSKSVVSRPKAPIDPVRIVVAREVNGALDKVAEIYRR